jgi:membrane protein implicated in regulation of membrane protease activity
MAKNKENTKEVRYDPFDLVFALFFACLALAIPIATVTTDGKVYFFHLLSQAVMVLVSAFFFWRWFRGWRARPKDPE